MGSSLISSLYKKNKKRYIISVNYVGEIFVNIWKESQIKGNLPESQKEK